jgi:hypothetical protein
MFSKHFWGRSPVHYFSEQEIYLESDLLNVLFYCNPILCNKTYERQKILVMEFATFANVLSGRRKG